MPTNNSIDLGSVGICRYDGAGTFSGVTTTQYAPQVGAASNGLSSIGPLTNGQILIGSTGANPVASSLSAGTGISITPGVGSITIASIGGGVASLVVSTATNMVTNTIYGSNGAGSLAFTLPAVANVGDIVGVIGMAVGWSIIYGAGQEIWFGSTHTTATTGSLTSTNAGNCVFLKCMVASTGWYVVISQGNITVV